VFRVADQDSTHKKLMQQRREKQFAKARLLEEKEKLKEIQEEMKYTSQRQLAR
jgi:hypothetical protein